MTPPGKSTITCPLHEVHGERIDKLEKANGRLIFLILTSFLGLASSFFYFGHSVGSVGEVLSKEVNFVQSSINKRITECMDKANDKISSLNIETVKQSVQLKDFSERLYGISSKQTVMLEKITRDEASRKADLRNNK